MAKKSTVLHFRTPTPKTQAKEINTLPMKEQSLIFWEKVKGLPTIDPVKDLWPKSFWVPVDENETDGWDAESAKHAKMQCFSCFCKPQRDSNGENILSKFCPNCGAMMEELK